MFTENDQHVDEVKNKRAKETKRLLKEPKTVSNTIRLGASLAKLINEQAKKEGMSSTEYQRQTLAKEAMGIQISDRIEERVTGMNETLKFMRTRIDESIEKQESNISEAVIEMMKLMNNRDQAFKELCSKRDSEYAQITKDLLDLTSTMALYFTRIVDKESDKSGQV